METIEAPVIETQERNVEDEIHHWTCCEDLTFTYCKKRVEYDPTLSPQDISCVVCIDLGKGSYCPHGHNCW